MPTIELSFYFSFVQFLPVFSENNSVFYFELYWRFTKHSNFVFPIEFLIKTTFWVDKPSMSMIEESRILSAKSCKLKNIVLKKCFINVLIVNVSTQWETILTQNLLLPLLYNQSISFLTADTDIKTWNFFIPPELCTASKASIIKCLHPSRCLNVFADCLWNLVLH